MPLPTSTPVTAADAYTRVVNTAVNVKASLTNIGSLIAGGSQIYVINLIGLYGTLNGAQGVGLTLQAVSGLSDYAKTATGNPNYDINADFAVSIIACKQVTDWLLANLPNDGQGGIVGWRHQADGSLQPVTVDPSTLAPLASLITAALATFS